MEYVIAEVSGRQFWFETGKYYDLNRISIPLKTKIIFNRILLLKKSNTLLIGKPYLFNTEVSGEILEHLRGRKIIVYKMRPKKKTRKKKGHRQELTRVKIEAINTF